jgi:HAMP domain-containing protein
VDKSPLPPDREQMRVTGAAVGLGCSIVVTLVGLIAGGVALDQYFGTAPTLTFIGIALALIAAGYELFELARLGRADRPAGPLGRRLTKMTGRTEGSATPPAPGRRENMRMDGEE